MTKDWLWTFSQSSKYSIEKAKLVRKSKLTTMGNIDC